MVTGPCPKAQPKGGGKGVKGQMCSPNVLYTSEALRVKTLTDLGVIKKEE